MARRKHTAEQIINKLREAEVAINEIPSLATAHVGPAMPTTAAL